MPTPLEILVDPVSLAVLAMYAMLIIWEALFPARQLPKIKFWKVRGLTAFAFFFYLSSYLPLFTDPYLEAYRLLDLTGLGALGGGLIGVLLYEFGVYVWHRALHTSNFLWRTLHQMHHSAERLDTYGAFYFSPLDMIGWTVLGSLCFALVIGLSPQAITITLLMTNFMGMFQHANIKTPRWMGYIVQRPESHTIHHAKGIHKYNYSDLPIFDILFGTFKNPNKYEHQTGFYYGASAKVLEMLSFKDLNKEREKKKAKNVHQARIKKLFSMLLITGLILGCNKDDGISVVPDSVEETPQPYENQEPKLGEISPLTGPKGTVVVINGEHFGTDASQLRVYFNEKEAIVETVTDTKITVSVPIKAGVGAIKVEIDGKELMGPEFEYQFIANVSTYAGGEEGLLDGIGEHAQFNNPQGIARDLDGNLYVVDGHNHVIRKITSDGLVTTYAGGKKGDADGTLSEAKFSNPIGIAIDENDNIYVADAGNNKIRKITPFGVVITLAGSKQNGFEDGPGNDARFDYPVDVDLDSAGNLFVADYYNNKIRKITPEGVVSTVAGSSEGFADGPALEAKFYLPTSVIVGRAGELYVADEENYKVRKITNDGNVITFAGSTSGFADGTGSEAQFSYIETIEMDFEGNIWVADGGNDRIRKITPDGSVTTITGSTRGFLDGLGISALFNNPTDLAITNDGTVYVADMRNHKIRKITQE